jgi:enoyl-CoA hydratase/carnithine racemase
MVVEERRDGVAWLTFDRPERLNAFTTDGYVALREALERAIADDDVRAIVLTGAGRAFSAGADRSLVDGSATSEQLAEAGRQFEALFDALARCDTPVVAAVNGVAVGAGCTMLLHCDLVVVAASARLRLPFTSLGILPEAGSSYLLPARTRPADATWALLSSDWIDAEGAHAMGLAWRVVPDEDLVAEVDQVASRLAALDPWAVRRTKRLLLEARADALRAARERETILGRERSRSKD